MSLGCGMMMKESKTMQMKCDSSCIEEEEDDWGSLEVMECDELCDDMLMEASYGNLCDDMLMEASYGNFSFMSLPVPCAAPCAVPQSASVLRTLSLGARAPPKKGKSTAARVSRGSEVDTWKGLTVQEPQRNEAEHITVTVVIYNTVAGGVPSVDDVAAAVSDMEELYSKCVWNGRLAEEGADFMKAELTVADAAKISNKIAAQPYKPSSQPVVGCDTFPVEEDDEEPAVHSNVICDVSDKKIVGKRYHKKGEDYDLCETEFRKLCAEEQVLYEMICRPGAEPVDVTMTMSA